jgi:uncharacterized protein DUF5677
MANTEVTPFGFPDFAPTLLAKYGPALRLANAHSHLVNEMVAALPKEMKVEQAVIYGLVRMATTGWVELLILVGNGAGLGAMKIARGMFETSVVAEYLRQFPAEIEDYLEYFHILSFKRIETYRQHAAGLGVPPPEDVPKERLEKIEKDFHRVKSRFQDRKGRIRSQWNKHPISYMAEKIGRKNQYEMTYSLAASIHHGSFEALMAHLSGDGSEFDVDSPPSLEWIDQALLDGHLYLLQALDTLNDLLKLSFDERLRLAGEDFQEVWRKPPVKE